MKSRNLIRGLGGSALAAAALAFSVSANAETQLIHFDDASNGWQWYSTDDRNFTFDPVNMNSDTKCADSTDGGNGNCVLEGGQGVLPLMIRPTNQTDTQGSSGGNAEPDFEDASGTATPGDPGILQEFTLDSFYWLLVGSGQGPDPAGNTMTVCGGNGDPNGVYGDSGPPDPDIETVDADKDGVPSDICDGYYSFTFYENGTVEYTGPAALEPTSLPTITYYESHQSQGGSVGFGDEDAVEGQVVTNPLEKNTGYIATFGDLFADVTWIQWTALGSAQFRLDCVVASADDLVTSEPLSGFSDYGCGGVPVPEPGTLGLFGMGLLGMALGRRFRRVQPAA